MLETRKTVECSREDGLSEAGIAQDHDGLVDGLDVRLTDASSLTMVILVHQSSVDRIRHHVHLSETPRHLIPAGTKSRIRSLDGHHSDSRTISVLVHVGVGEWVHVRIRIRCCLDGRRMLAAA